jgi:hypothetical protein
MEDGLTNSMGLPFGKHVRIYDAYVEARQKADAGLLSVEEAMSTSDFPTYISKLIRHTFLGRFNEIQGVWTQYTRALSVEDFEDYTSSRWGRFADIPEKSLNGEYDQLAIKEFPAETVRLREWGAGFGLTRQLIISDRLNKMAELPTLLAEALARTMSKESRHQPVSVEPDDVRRERALLRSPREPHDHGSDPRCHRP